MVDTAFPRKPYDEVESEFIREEIARGSYDDLEITEEVHSGEFGDRGYTRFYIEREIGRLDDALDDEDLKDWAVDRMVDFHDDFTPILDDELD